MHRCILVHATGCTGHGIQYYAEDLQFDGALATHYCGVAADWQSPPGELLKLISSVRGRGSATVCIVLSIFTGLLGGRRGLTRVGGGG